jgi:Tfp pilus assembly protein PilX
MEKISASDVRNTLIHAAESLKQASAALREKEQTIQEFRRRQEAEKLATELEAKNLSNTYGHTQEEVVTQLMNLTPEKRAGVEEAVRWFSSEGKFASIDTDDTGGVKDNSAFVQFITGNIN